MQSANELDPALRKGRPARALLAAWQVFGERELERLGNGLACTAFTETLLGDLWS